MADGNCLTEVEMVQGAETDSLNLVAKWCLNMSNEVLTRLTVADNNAYVKHSKAYAQEYYNGSAG